MSCQPACYRFIDDFLDHLYKIIQMIKSVRDGQVQGLYLQVNNKEKFPCIYIIVNSIEDKSRFDQQIYEIEFEISVHTRQQSNRFLTNLASEIKEVITQSNCSFSDHDVIGISNNRVDFEQARDLISNKMSLRYKAMILRR